MELNIIVLTSNSILDFTEKYIRIVIDSKKYVFSQKDITSIIRVLIWHFGCVYCANSVRRPIASYVVSTLQFAALML